MKEKIIKQENYYALRIKYIVNDELLIKQRIHPETRHRIEDVIICEKSSLPELIKALQEIVRGK